MEKRIQLECRGKEPSVVKELNLDNCRATQIEGLTDKYTGLEMLSMINVGLTSLKGFPKLPELKKLELSDNRISSGLAVLKDCPKLSHLSLSNNRIKDLESLEPLQSLKSLKNLDLFNNDVCNQDDYRNKIFKLLPDLEFLDDADKDGNEIEESDGEDGKNGTADDDDEDGGEEEAEDEEDVEEEESGEEEEGPGLAALYGNDLDDEEDDDFDETAEEEDEDLDEEEEEESHHEPSGKRRRVEEEPAAEGDTA